MGQPNFTRYWIAELDDGSIVSKFDNDGNEHSWERDYRDRVSVRTIRYAPIPPSLVEKIREKGNLATSLPLKTFTFNVPEGADVEILTRNFLEIRPFYHCLNCNKTFVLDAGTDVICPHCFVKNEWYCSNCNDIDDHPVFIEKTREVRCSRCEKTRNICGLQRIINIRELSGEVHRHFHILRINGEEHHIFDDRVE